MKKGRRYYLIFSQFSVASSKIMATSSSALHETSAADAAYSETSPYIYRGIINSNGTGCHTSSALQLMYHCFPKLREEVLNLANVSANYAVKKSSSIDEESKYMQSLEKEFVYQLSWFFYLLASSKDVIEVAQLARRKRRKSKRKKTRRKKKEIEGKKAAAIDAFVTKSREGKTNMHEWRNLVDSMKELNRTKYEKALGQVLDSRRSSEQHEEMGQYEGNLGGGRKLTPYELSSTTLDGAGDAIDPTKFYEKLMSYTIDAMETRNHINTNNVGDAAVVFRCLIATLEFSINRELKRLDEVIGLIEIDNWNNADAKEDEENNVQQGEGSAYKLRAAMNNVRAAMEYEWKGDLLSRIVGTSQSAEVSADNMITTTTITRTKNNGNIVRPVPIPWQLPVLSQTNAINTNKDSTTCYFESLTTSLHSVTIYPNPIRGYNWHGLVKSGDVNEETTTTIMDEEGNVFEKEEEEEKASSQGTDTTSPIIVESKGENTADSEGVKSPATRTQSDDASVVSTMSKVSVSSRTIGTQTDLENGEVKTITVRSSTIETETKDSVQSATESATDDATEISSSRDNSIQSSTIEFNVKKDACYAAAVAALSSAQKARRDKKQKADKTNAVSNESVPGRDVCYAAAAAALASAPSRNLAMDDIEVSYTTTNSGSDDDISFDFNEDSNSESSIDSKVSSVDYASSETHSSAIETPSDIDNISLGSWTDSEADAIEEKKSDEDPLIRNIYPAISVHEGNNRNENANAEVVSNSIEETIEETVEMSAATLHIAHSNTRDLKTDTSAPSNDDVPTSSSSSSSSSFSSSTSSTGSDSTSSTDSSSSSSSSSSSDIEIDIVKLTENNQDEHSSYAKNASKQKEWTTRKETRICQPLPRSLIFHLKRFAFNSSGHAEKLPGYLEIPEELNLKNCCLELDGESSIGKYCYRLTGALVHVDPVLSKDEEDQLEYGSMAEGHYVTIVRKATEKEQGNKTTWVELDDEFVRVVNSRDSDSSNDTALDILSGCDVTNTVETCNAATSSKRVVKEKERRYATLVVYSRI